MLSGFKHYVKPLLIYILIFVCNIKGIRESIVILYFIIFIVFYHCLIFVGEGLTCPGFFEFQSILPSLGTRTCRFIFWILSNRIILRYRNTCHISISSDIMF